MRPPQLSTYRKPLYPLLLFSQGASHHRSPLTTIISSLSLYQHHRYQLQYFHSQPRCRSLRLRNYPLFVSFALTDAYHSFWVHNIPSAFPNSTVFYSFSFSVLSTCGRPHFWTRRLSFLLWYSIGLIRTTSLQHLIILASCLTLVAISYTLSIRDFGGYTPL